MDVAGLRRVESPGRPGERGEVQIQSSLSATGYINKGLLKPHMWFGIDGTDPLLQTLIH